VDTFEHMRAASLPTILATSFAKGACTQREIERAAALNGHPAFAVEIALASAERAGLLVRETVFRVTDADAAPSLVALPEPAREQPRPRPRPLPPDVSSRIYWASVLAELAALHMRDECDLRRDGYDLRTFGKQLSVQIAHWKRGGKLFGRFRTRRNFATDAMRVSRIG
jgi:hypothetical protein